MRPPSYDRARMLVRALIGLMAVPVMHDTHSMAAARRKGVSSYSKEIHRFVNVVFVAGFFF